MSTFWRQAGLNYVKYSNICAQAVRESLKPEIKEVVLKRIEPCIIKATKWEGGKPAGQVAGPKD